MTISYFCPRRNSQPPASGQIGTGRPLSWSVVLLLATTPHRRRTTPLDGTPNSGLQILPNMTDDGSSLDVEKRGTDSARSDDDASTSSSHPSPTRLGADAPAKDRKSRSDPDDIGVDVPGLDLDLELARVCFSPTPCRSPRG